MKYTRTIYKVQYWQQGNPLTIEDATKLRMRAVLGRVQSDVMRYETIVRVDHSNTLKGFTDLTRDEWNDLIYGEYETERVEITKG